MRPRSSAAATRRRSGFGTADAHLGPDGDDWTIKGGASAHWPAPKPPAQDPLVPHPFLADRVFLSTEGRAVVGGFLRSQGKPARLVLAVVDGASK